MKQDLRPLIADALYPTKAYSLPAVCERYGMEGGDNAEAFSSKTKYILVRLEKLPSERVLAIAKNVVNDFPNDRLIAALETIEKHGRTITDLTRHHLMEALYSYSLSGKRPLLEMISKHFPSIYQESSSRFFGGTVADDLVRHAVNNNDLTNAEILEMIGFLTCSQAKIFAFIEDMLHPLRRDQREQLKIISVLNPIFERDGYRLVKSGTVSGYPLYLVGAAQNPSDETVTQVLASFDQAGVHAALQKALERRATDPEGAITAARTLLETVCKHILDDIEQPYDDAADLPKLWALCAEKLNLLPGQHAEKAFKAILGNCQSIVGNLATIRNRVSDAHGQGRRPVKPKPRHAELAVNLAGAMAAFLVATWQDRKAQS